jgi:hypothetical protein
MQLNIQLDFAYVVELPSTANESHYGVLLPEFSSPAYIQLLFPD